MRMKYNAIGLIRRGAEALRKAGDEDGTAYALDELGNNLAMLMRGKGSIQKWNDVYTGQDAALLDLDELYPVREQQEEA